MSIREPRPQVNPDQLPDHASVLPEVPHDASGLEVKKAEKKKLPLGSRIGGAAAGVALAGTAVFGAIAVAGDNESESDPQEQVEPGGQGAESAEERGNETILETLPKLESIQIPANLDPEEKASAVIELFSDWGMTGADRTTYSGRSEGDYDFMNLSEFTDVVASARAPVYATAAYGSGYESDPTLLNSVDKFSDINSSILEIHYRTYGSQNSSQWYSRIRLDELVDYTENTDGTESFVVMAERIDNAGQGNIVVDADDTHSIPSTWLFTTKDVGEHSILVAPPTTTD